jgi:inhibitor of KinA
MDVRIKAAGDSAWLIELPERIDAEVNARAIRIAKALDGVLPITDIVVGYRTVMVYINPLDPRTTGIDGTLREIATSPPPGTNEAGALVDVPVCYNGAYGPDLADVAAFGRCSTDDVITTHLAAEYRVYMVGFVPGFAYMAPVASRIAAPRRASPRLKVPAGSVAVAAGQTGVYPAETPGGWNLIGRCPIRPYDPSRAAPFLFRPGDRVRFRRISEADYKASSQWGDV